MTHDKKNLFYPLTIAESNQERETFHKAMDLNFFFDKEGPSLIPGLYDTSSGQRDIFFETEEDDEDGYS